ncbi:cuticle protein 8-like [Daphnia carinata]|uniref:cuticle protein 8-like n=1 Tax=Daphnia carinata TaxID=120202 RepID=UPI0025798652|nr:cuticle protein 8-like [Daphnia carinata]
MKVLLILAVAVVASDAIDYPKSAYSTPGYPTYGKYNDYSPMPYNFAWAVKDDYFYNDYAHRESSDDKGYVSGSYRTLLPDGRTQTVTYKANDYTGYVADVKYDREAKYYEYKPAVYPYQTYSYPTYQPAYPSPSYRARY